jgi:Uma2 family endonuclease
VELLDPNDWPDISHLVTEDAASLINIPSLRQQALLIDSLYSSYNPPDGQPFLATANVGIFSSVKKLPLTPDFFLCLNTSVPEPYWAKEHRSFFTWVHGKVPELVLEIVSNKEGGEEDSKLREYARLRILFYVIFDPGNYLSDEPLRVFALQRNKYERVDPQWLPELELGLVLQRTPFEGMTATWLRWCDASSNILLTGSERADQERLRADQEKLCADQAATQNERLRAQLRALGVEPSE